MFKISNNILVKTFVQLKELLPKELRAWAIGVLVFLMISSVIEFLGLALLIPLFSVVVDFESITNIEVLNKLYQFFNFSSPKIFSIFLAISIGCVFLVKNVLLMLIVRNQVKFSFKLFNFYTNQSLDYYFNKGYHYIKSTDANTIARNIMSVSRVLTRNYVIPYLNLINEVFIVVIIMIVLIYKNPLFVLILLGVLLPFFYLFYFLIRKRIQRLERIDLDLQPKVGKTIFQIINGYLDTLVNKAYVKLKKRNSEYIDEMCDNGVELITLKASPPKMVELSMVFSLITIVCFGLYYFDSSSELLTAMAFFGLAAFRIMPSINRILISLVTIKGNDYIYEFLKPVSDYYKAKKVDIKAEKFSLSFDESIIFDNISYAYPEGKSVFEDFSFRIEKNQVVGIIGPSGSGKSTLVLLMLGVITPIKGKIIVDDIEINEHNVSKWHDIVGLVPQEVFLFDGTIAENVTLNTEVSSIDLDRLNKAIELSSLSDYVNSLDKGMYSLIDDKGSNLSGGQKQRIAIARAIYNGSKLIVFDEATSSLDIETEKEIKKSILKLQQEGYTVVIIAHRYTTLAHCDKIIEINEGAFSIISKQELKDRMSDLI